MIKYKDHALD